MPPPRAVKFFHPALAQVYRSFYIAITFSQFLEITWYAWNLHFNITQFKVFFNSELTSIVHHRNFKENKLNMRYLHLLCLDCKVH